MEKKNICRHCPEAEQLMGTNIPFVTRHGVTVVLLVMIILGICFMLSDGPMQQLVKDILCYTIEQIISRFN